MLSSLFLMIPLATIAPAVADSCELGLDTVLERYVDTRGGRDAVHRLGALRILSTHRERDWIAEFDFRVMKPGYMWIQARYEDGAIYTEGFDGERAWEKLADEPAEYVGGDAARALQQGAESPVFLYGLHDMAGRGAEVSFEGCATIEETGYYVINVVSRFGTDIDYYVNRETFLLERARSTRPLHPSIDPTPIVIEERWADFRTVAGVLFPYEYSQWNVEAGEQLSALTVQDIIVLVDAGSEDFQKPR